MVTVRGNPVAWADFYKTARWKRLRRLQLRERASFVWSARTARKPEQSIVVPPVIA
jgi:hypothetical protein